MVRVSITVNKKEDVKETHELGVEVHEDDVIFYVDGEEAFFTKYENFEDLIVAVSLIWGEWTNLEKKE